MVKIHWMRLRMANAYLIENRSGMYLIDTGMPGDAKHILEKMESLDRMDLKIIYLTHAHIDHDGGAAALKSFTGAPIAIHHADANSFISGRTELGEVRGRGWLLKWLVPIAEPYMRSQTTEVDVLLNDGDRLDKFGLDAVVIHTPGHTSGSSSLLVEGRYLFTGDLVTTHGKPHVQKYYASDWDQIPISVERIRSAGAELIYPGHGRYPLGQESLEILCESK